MPKKTWILALNEELGEVMTLDIGKTWEPVVGMPLPASQLGLRASIVEGFRVAKILDEKASTFAAIVKGERFLLDDFNCEGAEEYCKTIQDLEEAFVQCQIEGKSFFDD